MPQATVQQQINGLYISTYGRAADAGGYEFWINQLNIIDPNLHATVQNAPTLVIPVADAAALGQLFVTTQSSFFQQTYGGLNDLEFVNQIYINLGGNTGDAGGIAFWFAKLQALEGQGATEEVARSLIMGEFTHDLISFDTTTKPPGLSDADFEAAVQRTESVLNKVNVSIAYEAASENNPFLIGHLNNGVPDAGYIAAEEIVTNVNFHSETVDIQIQKLQAAIDDQSTDPISPVFIGTIYTATVGQDHFPPPPAVITGGNVVDAPLAGLFGDQATLTQGDNYAMPGQFNVLNATFDTKADTDTPTEPGYHYVAAGLNITGIQTWNISNVGPYGKVELTGDSLAPGGKHISDIQELNYDAHSGHASLFIGNNSEPVVGDPGQYDGFTIRVRDAVGTGHNGVDVDFQAGVFTGNDTINVVAHVVGGFDLDRGGSLIVPDPIVCECEDDDDVEQQQTEDCDSLCVNWEGFYENAFAIASGASSGPSPEPGSGLPATGAVGFRNWDVRSVGTVGLEPDIPLGSWVLPDGVNIIALGGEGSQSAESLTLHDDGSSTILFATDISDSLGSADWKNLTDINLSDTSGFVVLTGAELPYFGKISGIESSGLLAEVGTDPDGVEVTIQGGQGNSFYDLTSFSPATAEISHIDGGHGTSANSEVAFNNDVLTLPPGHPVDLSHIQVLDDASDSQGGHIHMTNFPVEVLNADYTLLGGGTVDAGKALLQFLGADGCTGTQLTSDLIIDGGPTHFAINMQDMADDGWDITILGAPIDPLFNDVSIWVSDGVCPLFLLEDNGTPGTLEVIGSEVYNVPVFAVDNYSAVNIWMPFEGEYIGLGTNLFTVQPVLHFNDFGPVVTVTFNDNVDDTGCADEGSPDNLYLGHTQTYDDFFDGTHYSDANAFTLIGTPTVVVDQFIPPDQQTIIQDLGHGFFEIGATDTTDLYAQSTSHLVMDLPGTGGNGITGSGENLFTAHGITVQGAAQTIDPDTGDIVSHASLLQGTSGPIQLDTAAIFFPDEGPFVLNDAYFGAVGNDTIFANSVGDNVFGEGGNDTIHLIDLAGGQTVWIGAYDVGHSAGLTELEDPCLTYEPGLILEQAITDTDLTGTQHLFVDGYGDHVTEVTGFDLGNDGDALNFLISDWAATGFVVDEEGPVLIGEPILGLTQWDGQTQENGGDDVVFQTIASSGQTVNFDTDVLLDDIGSGYLSAAALQAGLTGSQGFVLLNDSGVLAGTTADMLVAYKTGDGGINIADVTISAGTTDITDTHALGDGSLQVHDLVHLTGIPLGVGVGNFTTDNIHLLA